MNGGVWVKKDINNKGISYKLSVAHAGIFLSKNVFVLSMLSNYVFCHTFVVEKCLCIVYVVERWLILHFFVSF